MLKFLIINSLCIIFSVSMVFSQNESDGQIDSVSVNLFWSFQENDPESMDFHLVKHEDLNHVINLFKEQINEEELANELKQMDSIPQLEKKNWSEKFGKIMAETDVLEIDWKSTNYLLSDIEYKVDEMTQLIMAKVRASFESGDRNFNIEYDVIKMPRGWVFGNKLHFNEIAKED